ncbi:MAG: GYF domain-containing protein [Muribaculaceae bacterium]|nr:GYF domain-containing protein [Muribaculaceae bacterium]
MKYYAIINDEQIGPMELPELVERGLMPETYVWCKGMDDWKQANEVADICRFFRNRIFDLMHPTVSSDDTPTERAQVMPMADEDYKGLKRRDFYQAVGEQIQQTYTDPDQEKMSQGVPPTSMPTWVLVLGIILFFPLGIPAVILSKKAKKQWHAGMVEDSFHTAALSKMYAGLALSLGVVAYTALIQWVLR